MQIYHMGLLLFAFNLSFLYVLGHGEMPGGISIGSVFPDPLESVVGIQPGKLKNLIRC